MLLIKLFDGLSHFVARTCFTLDAVTHPALCLNQILEPDCFLVSFSTSDVTGCQLLELESYACVL